ncbi:MAG: HDOD domain-containing protein [Chitinivibrionales bacterium]|nr:HDOD domain-containing protein [Chitinivibrionales bacterium]
MEEFALLFDRLQNLPSPSPVLQRIRTIITNPESSAQDLVDALKLDPAMAGKVLKLANSAYIGIPRTVSSLQNAVVLLGQKRLYSLVMGASVLSNLRVNTFPSFFNIKNYWRHSITTAVIAESIAKHLNRYDDVFDSDEVFTIGILHDIGKLVLCGYDPERVNEALSHSKSVNKPFYLSEEPQCSHMKIGAALAYHWNFPDVLADAIEYHHTPLKSEKEHSSLSIVHTANCIAHVAGFPTFEGEIDPPFDDAAVAAVRLSPERLRVITENTLNYEKKTESLLDFMT